MAGARAADDVVTAFAKEVSGNQVEQSRRATNEDLASHRCDDRASIVYRRKLQRDELRECRSIGSKTGRCTQRLQRLPLIVCEIVVGFHAHAFPSSVAGLLQISHENGATIMSQDFVFSVNRCGNLCVSMMAAG